MENFLHLELFKQSSKSEDSARVRKLEKRKDEFRSKKKSLFSCSVGLFRLF